MYWQINDVCNVMQSVFFSIFPTCVCEKKRFNLFRGIENYFLQWLGQLLVNWRGREK